MNEVELYIATHIFLLRCSGRNFVHVHQNYHSRSTFQLRILFSSKSIQTRESLKLTLLRMEILSYRKQKLRSGHGGNPGYQCPVLL